MELNDALAVPLAAPAVWAALQDLALLRASVDHCERFAALGDGHYALDLTVPLGPLRARYEVRAQRLAADVEVGIDADANARAGMDGGSSLAGPLRRTFGFKAATQGIGVLRGQLELALTPIDAADGAGATRIDYLIQVSASGPLAELPSRQIEHALRQLIDDFLMQFGSVVQAKYGLAPNRRGSVPSRHHVFLRPDGLGGVGRRASAAAPAGTSSGRAAQALSHRLSQRRDRPWPARAWMAAVGVAVLLAGVAHWWMTR
ncbi:MAG: hypothetical protein GAK40_01248 [Burkholderia plantarii]|nr:MAG: hypothetical protein GAK40_01248 [Burkholderia plantarii]